MACAGYESAVLASRYQSSLIDAPPLFEERDPSRFVQYRSGMGTAELPAEGLPDWVRLYEQDRHFAAFVNEILSLFTEQDEIPPHGEVVIWVLASSVLAKQLLGQKWAIPRVSTDDAGGLRLSWRNGAKELRAVVPADLLSRYLYWQDGEKHGGDHSFGSGTLYARLQWLNEREPR
jgi:hypothetical protein